MRRALIPAVAFAAGLTLGVILSTPRRPAAPAELPDRLTVAIPRPGGIVSVNRLRVVRVAHDGHDPVEVRRATTDALWRIAVTSAGVAYAVYCEPDGD